MNNFLDNLKQSITISMLMNRMERFLANGSVLNKILRIDTSFSIATESTGIVLNKTWDLIELEAVHYISTIHR